MSRAVRRRRRGAPTAGREAAGPPESIRRETPPPRALGSRRSFGPAGRARRAARFFAVDRLPGLRVGRHARFPRKRARPRSRRVAVTATRGDEVSVGARVDRRAQVARRVRLTDAQKATLDAFWRDHGVSSATHRRHLVHVGETKGLFRDPDRLVDRMVELEDTVMRRRRRRLTRRRGGRAVPQIPVLRPRLSRRAA